jgi:hypothetical protein
MRIANVTKQRPLQDTATSTVGLELLRLRQECVLSSSEIIILGRGCHGHVGFRFFQNVLSILSSLRRIRRVNCARPVSGMLFEKPDRIVDAIQYS